MNTQVVTPIMSTLNDRAMASVLAFIEKLLNDFITAFIVFVAVLSVAVLLLIFMGFRVLRKSMWETNIILKIIPFESLPRADRIEIKDFYNS